MSILLSADGVRYRYADASVGLSECTLHIERGTKNALLGANGSGKTTLLQHFNGLLKPEGGEIRFAGEPLNYRRAALHALRSRVGMVFQNPDRQLFSANVSEDISFGPLNLGLDPATVHQRVTDALHMVGLQDLADRPVHHLSYGQKKRVCLAGVLAMQPEVLLLDEPMAGLDAGMQHDLLALLDQLAAQGITIVLSTHDVDFAYRWADRLHLLAGGRCLASFAASDLPQHSTSLAQAGHQLPQVFAWHARLAEYGLCPGPLTARSLAQLLEQLPPAALRGTHS